MSSAVRIGILGGTLDPIHLGHLQTAVAARHALALDRVIVLPSHVPPHRGQQPLASPYHRFAMAALAVNGVEGLNASDLELCSPGPSYTADTLARMRAKLSLQASQIFFITGADAFAEIETWSRYPAVLDLAHFIVVSRPGFPVGALRDRLPGLEGRMCPATRATWRPQPGGYTTAIFLLDAETPDVSSTEIRRRLAAGEPLSGLVPPPVEQHIAQHDLYVKADQLHG
jgi:nicotinate-nucleotide adenylyltransferase